MRAVILAGGKGTRLAPFTSVLPKPLMPIGDRAILEIVVEQLRSAGFEDLTFCVGYLSHLIEALFNNGTGRGVTIDYVRELEPLGTAGPLTLVDGLDETFLAMNGDVLTTLPYADMLDQHNADGNLLTLATHRRTTTIDYGIVYLDEGQPGEGHRVQAFVEKPDLSLLVSMGIYIMEPEALEYVPEGAYFDLPALVHALLDAEAPVGTYPYEGFWLDIGRHEDFEKATIAWQQEHGEPVWEPDHSG
jgi:NDP-mannose synthase